MLVLALVGFAIAFTLVVYSLLSQVEDRAETRDSLSQLESYETETVRDQELSQPLSERVIVPVLAGLTRLGKRLTPVGYIESVRQKLVYAGSDNPDAGDRFLALRVVTVALIPVWFIIAFTLLPLEGMLRFLAFLLVAIGLALGPDAVLSRRVDARQHQLQVKLPDILDLLVISVEAGLGFEQALDRTVHAVPGPLSEEFARMLGELRRAPVVPTRFGHSRPGPRSPRCGRSFWRSSRLTRSACRSAVCCGHRPSRCVSSAASWPRRRHRRRP